LTPWPAGVVGSGNHAAILTEYFRRDELLADSVGTFVRTGPKSAPSSATAVVSLRRPSQWIASTPR